MAKHQIWTPEDDALVGTDSDQRVADALGVPRHVVRTRRVALNKPAFHEKMGCGISDEWSYDEIKLLGTMPDRDVSARTGRPVTAVTVKRNRLGIASFSELRDIHKMHASSIGALFLPDASKHNPNPEYLRDLLHRSGLTQQAAAERIGIGHRLLKYYLTAPGQGKESRVAPYPVQFALERLAASA